MDLCQVTRNGSIYAFYSNPMTGNRYWYCKQRGTGSGRPNIIVPLQDANELKLMAIKNGVPIETFAPPAKSEPVKMREPRIKTKIKLFDF